MECRRSPAFSKLVSFNFLILCFPESSPPTRLAADHLMRPHLQKESLYPPGRGAILPRREAFVAFVAFYKRFCTTIFKNFFYAELGLQMP